MRVLILTQWFDPEPSFKGLTFAKGLASRGNTVEILTGFPNYPGGKLYPGYRIRPWKVERMEGFRVCRVALYPSHDRSAARRVLNYASFAVVSAIVGLALVRRPDVIYVYHPPGTIGLPALILRWWFSAPIVYDVQDLWPDSAAATGMLSNRLALGLLGTFCRFVYGKADRVVVPSLGLQQTMIDRGIPKSRIRVIYNWAPEQLLAAPVPALAPRADERKQFRVVFAGTMGMAQALDTVLDAASECSVSLPHVRFVFVGGGVDRDRLEQRSRELRLENVEFVPMQPLSAMRAILDQADGLLVHLKDDPLFTITIPSKIQAYLAVGRPLIVAVSGDAADLVTRARAGVLAKPQNAGSIVHAVRTLSCLPIEERERMGQAARAFYKKELSIEVAVEKFQEVFDELTYGNRRSGVRGIPWLKRAIDIGGAALALALFGPILAVAAFAVRCTMGRPVLFRQERPGLQEKTFTLLKLRTMNRAVDRSGVLSPDQTRLTRVGWWLRKTSLDELPQLWNVLRGEMSLVGPRPLLVEYLPRYSVRQRRRHEVKPGMTGWAQVKGRNALTWEQKFELDIWYVDHQSTWLDIKILFLTIACAIRGEGISQAGHATMPKFQGGEGT